MLAAPAPTAIDIVRQRINKILPIGGVRSRPNSGTWATPMTLLAEQSDAEGRSVAASGLFEFEIFTDMASAEAEWRTLERSAVMTPYQRFDWVEGLLAAGLESADGLVVAAIRQDGRTTALLPLVIRRRWGVRVAAMVGTEVSNSDWLMAHPDFRIDAPALLHLLRQICAAAGGADLVTMFNQPAQWQGVDNPMLALGRVPGASNFYMATIGPTPVPYIEHRLSTKRRSNIKRGMRRLVENHGTLRAVRVNDAETLALAHRVFLEQRGARFGEMGVRNVFADPPFVRLFKDLAARGFGQERPAFCLHVLYAGDEIVATCWGAMAGDHYSQYINSTSSGPAAQYSLMAILNGMVMDDLTQAGIVTMDMGLGDFGYKTEWTEAVPVYHSVIPLTLRGRLAAGVLSLRASIKRQIKQTPWLWDTAKKVRQTLHRLTSKSRDE